MAQGKGTEKQENRVAIYSRKSKFTEKGDSIANQIELCKSVIAAKHPDVKDENIFIYEDEGYSGATTNRPEFKQMMADAAKNKFNIFVCYRLDRVSRSVSDFAQFFEKLQRWNIAFFSVHDNFDTDTPMGKAMLQITSVFAELERATIAERIRDNMLSLAKTGRWLGGNTPTGYKSEGYIETQLDGGKVRKAYKLKKIPKEIDLVKMIYRLFLELNSLTSLESYLMEHHIYSKHGKPFSRFTLRSILLNPVYMIADSDALKYFIQIGAMICSDESCFDGKHGIMAYNKTIQNKGSGNQFRDFDEWIIAVGKHSSIISGSDWVKVQSMLGQNKSKAYRKPRSHTALLSGLLYCSCGSYMRPKLSKRLNEHGEYIYSYLCEKKEKTHGKNCDVKNPNGNGLDGFVLEEIKCIAADPSEFISKLKHNQAKSTQRENEYASRIKMLIDEMDNNNKKLANLMKAIEDSDDSAAYKMIINQINAVNDLNQQKQIQLEELNRLASIKDLQENEFDLFRDMLVSFSRMIDSMSIEEKRAAIRLLVHKIVWDGENVRLYLFGSDDDDDIDLPDDENGSDESEPLRGGCERNSHVFPKSQENCAGRLHIRSDRYRQGW